jgi:Tetratricopeptide repeat
MPAPIVLLFAAALQPGYVDPATCRPCHQQIFAAYAKTGMGRSFGPARSVPPLDRFSHDRSRQVFSVIQRGQGSVLRRQEPAFERSIDYVIGSGNHSRTYVHQTANRRLIELPVSWYAEKGGSWAMSPGYDRPDHSGFRREVGDSCLFCHNGYPSQANAGLASGIDCQRCHGPGEAHLKRTGPIVNPAKLDSTRRLEVCLQCHLESASRTLPEAIRRPGRGPFSYRPGEPLADYKVYFQFTGVQASQDRITVNGAGYGLMKSQCFIRSEGRLQCTTCHDPHGQARMNLRQVCSGCHQSSHEAARQDCAGCHMPKRRTEDAVHVVMTDHFIRRQPLTGNPLAEIAERHDKLNGPVKLLYPPSLPETPDNALLLAMAGEDTNVLQSAMDRSRAKYPEPYLRLAGLFEKSGRRADALRTYAKAVGIDAADPGPYAKLVELSGDASQAARALALFPANVPLLNTVAVIYAGQSRFDEALPLLERAVSLSPEDSLSWLNLGVVREAKGNIDGASAAYLEALAAEPGFARARSFLARLQQRKKEK